MRSFSKYKVLLWDFDGVLMDSMPVRDLGFETVLSSYPKDEVEQLLAYHRRNGGLSRYVKFRYFFEEIRKQSISAEQLKTLTDKFSSVMMQFLINEKLLIQDSLQFVKQYHDQIPMHVISGSDGVELNTICRQLDIAKYFVSVHGSPTPKSTLIGEVLREKKYALTETLMIGDSINDYDAAMANHIDFCGYNNAELSNGSYAYVTSFNEVNF
jgi:phosphoglycolate phosphatase-like HAD superfamily hydrolase